MAGRFVDFYALLDVASDASFDVVRTAIARQRQACESYRASGSPADQQTTEDRIRDLDLAEYVLLDPDQRADYDEEWRERRNGPADLGAAGYGAAGYGAAGNGNGNGAAGNGNGAAGYGSNGTAAPVGAPVAGPAPVTASQPSSQPATREQPSVPPAPPAPPAPPVPSAPVTRDQAEYAALAGVASETAAPPAPTTGGDAQYAVSPPVTRDQDDYASLAAAPPVTPYQAGPAPQPAPAPAAPPTPPPTPPGASAAVDEDEWVVQARTAMQAGDAPGAVDAYHYAIMLHPEEIGLHYELGQAYALAGNYEQALGAYETASRLAPNIVGYRAAVGNALVHLGRPGDAIGVLEQVVAEVPTEPWYRHELAQALHDTCVHEMTPLTNGLVCITTAEQAQLVERLTGRALSLLDPADRSQLAEDVREKHHLAQLATQRVWRPPLPWWLMISFTAVITLGFALFVVWWSAPIVLIVLAGVAFLLGLQPTYWHVAREARTANLLA